MRMILKGFRNMKLFLARHGLTELNLTRVYYGRTDCDLVKEGEAQARRIGRLLAEVDFSKVYVSPLLRARHTAALILKENQRGTASTVICDDRLMELDFGLCEGMSHREVTQTHGEVWTRWAEDWTNTVMPGGESYRMVFDRITSFLDELRRMEETGNVLLVSHQGCLRSIIAYLLKMTVEGTWFFDFEQDAYSLFELDENVTLLRRVNSREKYL